MELQKSNVVSVEAIALQPADSIRLLLWSNRVLSLRRHTYRAVGLRM